MTIICLSSLFVCVLFCLARTLRDDLELHIHPSSVLYGEKPPKWSVHNSHFVKYAQLCFIVNYKDNPLILKDSQIIS